MRCLLSWDSFINRQSSTTSLSTLETTFTNQPQPSNTKTPRGRSGRRGIQSERQLGLWLRLGLGSGIGIMMRVRVSAETFWRISCPFPDLFCEPYIPAQPTNLTIPNHTLPCRALFADLGSCICVLEKFFPFSFYSFLRRGLGAVCLRIRIWGLGFEDSINRLKRG